MVTLLFYCIIIPLAKLHYNLKCLRILSYNITIIWINIQTIIVLYINLMIFILTNIQITNLNYVFH